MIWNIQIKSSYPPQKYHINNTTMSILCVTLHAKCSPIECSYRAHIRICSSESDTVLDLDKVKHIQVALFTGYVFRSQYSKFQ